MLSLRQWFFEPIEERNGRVLTFSRFHVFLTVLVALATMILLAATQERSISGKLGIAVTLSIACVLFAVLTSKRRIVFGTAFAIVTFRCILGVFVSGHPFELVFLAIATAIATYWLLKDAH